MTHVFISYKREDVIYRNKVISFLEEANIDYWVDMKIEAGSGWREEIDSALADAFALIVVVTPNASKSQYITYEWAWALGNKLPIYPLIFEQDNDLHAKLQSLQQLDCSSEIPVSLRTILEGKRSASRLSRYTNSKIAQAISSSVIFLIFIELFAPMHTQNIISGKQTFSMFMSFNREVQRLNWTGMADLWVIIASTLSPYHRSKLQELGDEINRITVLLNNKYIYGIVIDDKINYPTPGLPSENGNSPLTYSELMDVWNYKLKYLAMYFLDNTHANRYKDISSLIRVSDTVDIQSPSDEANQLIDSCFEILARNDAATLHFAEIKKIITGRVVTGG